MKDAARLAAYFIAIVVIGALLAPILFWSAQALATHGVFPFLAKYEFHRFFHRAILVAAVLLFWPLLRLSNVRGMADLGLAHNPRWARDVGGGVLLSIIPLLLCAALLIALQVYSFRHVLVWPRLGKVVLAAVTVPFIEEAFFRGIVLGVLLRTGRRSLSIAAVSALFAAVHFLKGSEREPAIVTWTSGFESIGDAFAGFGDLTMVVAAFATLFLIGCILGDARVLTRSLWLPIGLHAGWIFASGTFSWMARRQMVALPWLGNNLLVGIVPLGLAAVTWILMRLWFKDDRSSQI
ncbi:MAG TPA: CPBP family intramembrane glutamic endopeptidase [Candidatus Udaeobacter sp.]|nr:CPBP family intramembrane glutamic endopeptidase [Candidatus Udaeobacter sp.]